MRAIPPAAPHIHPCTTHLRHLHATFTIGRAYIFLHLSRTSSDGIHRTGAHALPAPRAHRSDEILQIEQCAPIMLRNFVKGSAGELLNRRDDICERLANEIGVPLIPQSWKVAVCQRVVDAVAEQLENAITASYEVQHPTTQPPPSSEPQIASAPCAAFGACAHAS